MTSRGALRIAAWCAVLGAAAVLGGLLSPDATLPLGDVSRYGFLMGGGALLLATAAVLAVRGARLRRAEREIAQHGAPATGVLRHAGLGATRGTRVYTWDVRPLEGEPFTWREVTAPRPGLIPGRTATLRVDPARPGAAVVTALGPHPWGDAGTVSRGTVRGWTRDGTGAVLRVDVDGAGDREARGDLRRLRAGTTVVVLWSPDREDVLAGHQVAEALAERASST